MSKLLPHELELLYAVATEHVSEHGCSAHPYKEAGKLFDIVAENKPHRILEIGTGMGFTALIMSLAAPDALIQTIEKDAEHANIARKYFEQHNVDDRIVVIDAVAEELLPELTPQFDLIFFDGYQIHFEFLPHYERLLLPGGLLVAANNHLTSKTSDAFFAGLQDKTVWEVLETFEDTTIAKKL